MRVVNHLSGVDRLANRFSIMRHGQSKANVAGIIVSCIENDRRGDYGLSEFGRQQVLAAAQGCGLPGNTVICSSDFSRARQTAEVVCAYLGAPALIIAEALRERCFGDWEGSATDNYVQVWAADETNCGYVDRNVEPVAAVLDRTTAFVMDLERRYRGRDILLVSHGDTLQILHAGFMRMDPSSGRCGDPAGRNQGRDRDMGSVHPACAGRRAGRGHRRADRRGRHDPVSGHVAPRTVRRIIELTFESFGGMGA